VELLALLLDYSSTLKEIVCSSETSVDFYRTTWRYMPEGNTLHSYRFENLNFNITTFVDIFFFSLWLYSPLTLGRLFSFLILYTVGRTPSTGDQPFAVPPCTHRTTQTQKKTHIDIHASSGIQTHDPSVRADEDGSCLRPCSHRDRYSRYHLYKGKSSPVRGRAGPYGCETSRLPQFLDNRLSDGCEVVSLKRRPPFTPEKFVVLISTRG
jgi:hypothetical protein